MHIQPSCNFLIHATTIIFLFALTFEHLKLLNEELNVLNTFHITGYHGPQIKPLPAFPLGPHAQPDHSSSHPLSHHAFEQSPLSSQHTSPAMKSGSSLLESSAMWDMMYGPKPLRPGPYGNVSSGSSGYQSGHTGQISEF